LLRLHPSYRTLLGDLLPPKGLAQPLLEHPTPMV